MYWYDRLCAGEAAYDIFLGGVEPPLASKLLNLRKRRGAGVRERTASLGWQGWRNVDVAHGGLARGYAPGMMHAAGLLRMYVHYCCT